MGSENSIVKIEERLIKERAEKVKDEDIKLVHDHAEAIERKFLGIGPIGTFVEEMLLSLSLIKDYWSGEYRKVPYWVIGAIVFMCLYVANPVDILPDVILGLGQLDDIAVVTLCLLLIRQELHEYRRWKEAQPDEED